MCDKLDRKFLCSVFCPSEYLENSLHAFFIMKKRLWTASGTGRVKKKKNLQMLISAFSCVYKHFAFEMLIKKIDC
ncbi:unnamed protein product [Staurois parvus]|uniref:Uncharacterized protein n=1 Tax=Staurois parvus TaxID=386267 RepID=A0ABN9C4M1_9NEOB|nr:unnamed protein product [Staurois parvus]